MSFEVAYLQSARKQFEYYRLLGEKTMTQLTDDQLVFQYNRESNSIAMIVHHLHGNMLSRWTDFLTTDGEKEWRQRDAEFDVLHPDRDTILHWWNTGWTCLFDALNTIGPEDWNTTVYIRHQGHSVADAINRQLCHYAYHVGQIVFIGKMIRDAHWTSLSIPRGKSVEYNAEKFARPKHSGHFTDEWLKGKNEK